MKGNRAIDRRSKKRLKYYVSVKFIIFIPSPVRRIKNNVGRRT